VGPRSSIVAGLLAGVAAAVVLVAGVLALAPGPAIPSPSAIEPSLSPSAAPSASLPAESPSVAPSSAPASASPAPGGSAFHVGEPAPPLRVPQVGGGTIDLAELHGKPVWVNFMATWCPPCQDEFPLMNGFAARYAVNDLVILAIDVEEEEGTVAAFAQSLSATFPLGLDTTGDVAASWDALALPVHFWVGADGVIRDGSVGGIGPDVMVRGLQSIMPGVDVRP
jgi:thiol-disulfide isomerase/thioredoxin